jgi:hypothetical protein
MALTKSIAGKRLPDGSWDPEKNIIMHPVEEAQIRAEWAIHDIKKKVPDKASREEEHEWLVEFGADYVKTKRAEWQAAYDAIKDELKAAEDKFQACTKAWYDHAELCMANKRDPNTFAGDARESLRFENRS